MLLNGLFLTRPVGAAARFALALIAALDRRGELAGARVALPRGAALQAVLPGGLPPGLPLQPCGRYGGMFGAAFGGRLGAAAWEQLDLPREAGDDWLVNLCDSAPLWRRRQLVLLHELAAPALAASGLTARRGQAWRLATLMQRADCLVVGSRHAADQLGRRFAVRAQGLEVLPPGGDHILAERPDRSVLAGLDLRGRRYLLAPDDAPTRALLRPVLERLADPHLLLVLLDDGAGPPVGAVGADGAVPPVADAAADPPWLRRCRVQGDAQRRALYEGAAGLVLVSGEAGPLLAPLEALCCGCPVVAAAQGALPERCGDAALAFDPADPATLLAQLQRLLASGRLAHELRAAGFERARQFTWDAAAQSFSALGQRLAA
ncbi:MAG: glycosyltransferase [Burkholderiaceae bacterium]|nr:glycosyltransferase [Burkholderiaceae bacterium]